MLNRGPSQMFRPLPSSEWMRNGRLRLYWCTAHLVCASALGSQVQEFDWQDRPRPKLQWRSFVGVLVACLICQVASGQALIAPSATLELGTSEVVRSVLESDLSIQSARRALALQSQGVRVAHRQFTPKVTSRVNAERVLGAAAAASGALKARAATSLDLTWLVATGATIKIGKGLERQRVSGFPDQQGGTVSATVSQPLLRGFGPGLTKSRQYDAESALRVAVAAVGRQAAVSVSSALGAYVVLQQAKEAVVQAVQAQALALRVYEFNQAMVGVGRSASIVMLQSESDVATAKLGVAQAENAERLAVRSLAQAMGRIDGFADTQLKLIDTLESSMPNIALDEAVYVATVIARSPELLAAREAVSAAQRGLDIARNDLLPALDVSLSRNLPTGARAETGRADTVVGINFELSLDRAEGELAKSAADANLDSARSQLADAERQVRDAAQDALSAHRFALAQLALANGANQLAARQLEAEVTRQRLGYVSQLELSNAQRAMASSNAQLRDVAQQAARSRVELARLAGTLLQEWDAQRLVDDWVSQALLN